MEIDTNQTEEIIEVGKANRLALLMLFPIAAITIIPFVIIYGFGPLANGVIFLKNHALQILVAFVLLIFVHEGLHGVTWAFFAKNGFKSIHFGIKWSYLTPYCHCNEPMKRKHYILGGIMPGLVTGVIPIIIAMVTANGWLLVSGIFLTAAAGGDIIVLIRVLKYPSNLIFMDHPKEIGFIVFKS